MLNSRFFTGYSYFWCCIKSFIPLKICGFSFIRNALIYDYPIQEAIGSILPLCDEIIIAVGKSEDDTLSMVKNISSKVKIIETNWDESIREGGLVLSEETNKALNAISDKFDWCIYVQGDEVFHQSEYDNIRLAMQKADQNNEVDGLLFDYFHFYGSYDYIATSGRWYQHEIRAFKTGRNVYSYKDAMGFRKSTNKKLKVIPSNANIYHYGWVKHPEVQQSKQKTFHKWWTEDRDLDKKVNVGINTFDYSGIDRLALFDGNHPKIMQERIRSKNWIFDFDIEKDNRSIKERIRAFLKSKIGWRPGEYRNYIRI